MLFFRIMGRASGSLSSGLGSVGQNAATRSGHGLSLCAVGYSQQAAAAVQSSAVLRVKVCNPLACAPSGIVSSHRRRCSRRRYSVGGSVCTTPSQGRRHAFRSPLCAAAAACCLSPRCSAKGCSPLPLRSALLCAPPPLPAAYPLGARLNPCPDLVAAFCPTLPSPEDSEPEARPIILKKKHTTLLGCALVSLFCCKSRRENLCAIFPNSVTRRLS